MSNEKDLSLEKYGISKIRYRELKYFCLQYFEKKQQISSLLGIRAVVNDGMPKGNKTSDPTAIIAARIAELQGEIEMIEQTAFEAAPGMCEQLIKNVTEGIPYEYMGVPCGRKQFYIARRKFFYLLSEKR